MYIIKFILLSHFVIKQLSDFVMRSTVFCNKVSYLTKFVPELLLAPKIRLHYVEYYSHFMSNVLQSFVLRERVSFSRFLWTKYPEWLGKIDPVNKNLNILQHSSFKSEVPVVCQNLISEWCSMLPHEYHFFFFFFASIY